MQGEAPASWEQEAAGAWEEEEPASRAGGGGGIPGTAAGSTWRERSCCDGVSCSGTVTHPGAANVSAGCWEQTAAPHVSRKKEFRRGFVGQGMEKQEPNAVFSNQG